MCVSVLLFVLFATLCCLVIGRPVKKSELSQGEYKLYSSMKPLVEDSPSIMFWRPQKVGSSTIVSILASYGFRFHALPRRKVKMNNFCDYIARCDPSKNATLDPQIAFRISLTHEVCNKDSKTIYNHLPCAFGRDAKQIKEIMIVREPIGRAVSVYYFWGELYKMMAMKGSSSGGSRVSKSKPKHRNGAPLVGGLEGPAAGMVSGDICLAGRMHVWAVRVPPLPWMGL